jgi:uncharacterized membrane protein YjgN (DUF898 family)
MSVSDTGVLSRASEKVKQTYRFGRAARDLDPDETREVESGQMTQQFTMMIQLAVTLAVGVLIVSQIFDALPAVDGPLGNASDQIESLTGQAFELAPIILIVLIAVLLISVVRRL